MTWPGKMRAMCGDDSVRVCVCAGPAHSYNRVFTPGRPASISSHIYALCMNEHRLMGLKCAHTCCLLTRAHLRAYISEMYVHIVRTRIRVRMLLEFGWFNAAECRPQPGDVVCPFCFIMKIAYSNLLFYRRRRFRTSRVVQNVLVSE